MVEEILLETVQDEQSVDVATLGPTLQHAQQLTTGIVDAKLVQDCGPQAGQGIGPPRMEDDDRVLGRAVRADVLPQPVCNPRLQQRALADAARPVDDGEPRRQDVRDDQRPLTLAAEEQQCIQVRRAEGRETLERRRRDVHYPATGPRTCSRRPSRCT